MLAVAAVQEIFTFTTSLAATALEVADEGPAHEIPAKLTLV